MKIIDYDRRFKTLYLEGGTKENPITDKEVEGLYPELVVDGLFYVEHLVVRDAVVFGTLK